MVQIYFIVVTALAFFGLYCLIVTIVDTINSANYPPTLVILKNTDEKRTYDKIKYIQENLTNNYIYLLDEDGANTDEMIKYLYEIMNVN